MNFHKLEALKLVGIGLLGVLFIFGSIAADIAINGDKEKKTVGYVMEPALVETVCEPLMSVPEPIREEIVEEVIVGRTIPVESVETVVEPVEAIVEEEEKYFDIALSEDLQSHIIELCESLEVDPAIVMAIIVKESNCNEKALGDGGNSQGLMQIQMKWHIQRMSELNCWDMLDGYQNVTVGINYLAELFESGASVEWVLMAYNGGHAYADRKYERGEISDYAIEVMSKAEALAG